MKDRHMEANARPALLVFLCLNCCLICAHTQGDSSPKLRMVAIQPEKAPGVYLAGAALSPDGSQVVAAFRRVSPGPKIAISVRIWRIGSSEPIATKELTSGESTPQEMFNPARDY